MPDIEAAKNIIGKTVELEFGLENDVIDAAAVASERQALAESLLQQATEGVSLEQLGSTNGSKGVSYLSLSGTLSQMPTLYQESDILDTLATGTLSTTIAAGLFQDYPDELAQYGYADQSGYTITYLVDRAVQETNSYDSAAFLAQVPDATLVTITNPTNIQTGTAYYADGKLVYPMEAVLPNQSGYNLEIYRTDTMIDGVTDQIDAGTITGGIATVYNGWLAADQVALAVPGFTYTPGQTWTTVAAGSGATLVKITDTKTTDQTLFEQYEYTTDEATANTLLDALTHPTIYTVEALFVADTQPWKAATDPQSGDILNGAFFEYAAVGSTQFGEPSVNITFNDAGKQIFCNITAANVNKQMAIFVGGELKTNPVINEKICGGQTQITGSFTREEATQLARDLNEGALPAPLMLVQEEKVSPTLGIQALNHILWAGLIGIVAIALYMTLVYGWRWALISVAILVAFIIFLFAGLKIIGAVLGLSGLAAIILSLGMSVDATILVYERIIENHHNGQSLRDSIIDAHKQAWSAVRDGNLSTGMIALLLVFMGVNIFK
ncbi:MAG: SecD/SecF family protein translocase subunit [Candidatus Peribacteria bacterium]|nr:MAG: SecD/SecF family protein translocase subunit [Candidatus Peribacteria bacterium]